MMKIEVKLLVIILLTSFSSCKKPAAPIEEPTVSKLINDSIPRFDSIDWFSAYDFEPFSAQEKEEAKRNLEKYYKPAWNHSNMSGGFLIARHGKIVGEGYTGFADYENQIPITSETPIHIASISKVLTGLAILKLTEYEKIDLDASAAHYIPEFPFEEVTVRDLLNHRSGLPEYLNLSDDPEFWDHSKMMSNKDVLDILISKNPPIQFPAGSKFSYANTNYVLLAEIIENVTGMDYPTAMRKMVFEPLGMENTFVMEFDKDADKVSKSYYHNGNEWVYDHLDKTYGDKNIYSTPRDLFKMDVAMYSDQFLPKKLKEEAWKGYSYEKRGVKNYGLGMRLLEWDDGKRLLYHKGLWHGNRGLYVRDIPGESTIIALSNRRNRVVFGMMNWVSLFGDYPFKVVRLRNEAMPIPTENVQVETPPEPEEPKLKNPERNTSKDSLSVYQPHSVADSLS